MSGIHLADWQKHRGPEVFWTQRSEAHWARRRAAPPSQYRQAVDAVRILAREILDLPWAATFDWQGLSDQAWSLEPDHRTLGRETITVHDGKGGKHRVVPLPIALEDHLAKK